MKRIKIDPATVRQVKVEGQADDRWVDQLSSEMVEKKWGEWKSHGPARAELTRRQRAEIEYVFQNIGKAFHDAERNCLARQGFPIGPGHEWIDLSVLKAISECRGNSFRRSNYQVLVGQVETASRNIESIAFEIGELLSLIRVEDGNMPGSDASMRQKASGLSSAGLVAAGAVEDYLEELRQFTSTLEAAFPSHRQKKVWRWSLTRSFAHEWTTAGGTVGDDLFRRVVAAAASAIEFICASNNGKIPAGFPKPVVHEECRWIDDALAFGKGAPWQRHAAQ